MGDAKNDVEVADRQQLLTPFPEPLLPCVNLALGAVAIPAGMEFDLLIPAANTLIAMPAQSCGAATSDGIEYLLSRPGQGMKKPGSDQADDIGDLPAWRHHDWTMSGGDCSVSRSSGLTASRIRCWDRCT